MSEQFDCIVVGIGGMGSAAVCELARRGVRVLGLEQFGPAHESGSSHGRTRIIRKAYFEHPDYVPLLQRAYVRWRELEAEAGTVLFDPVGLFLSGPAESTAIAGTRRAAAEHRLPLDEVGPAEARARFPGFDFDIDATTLFERDAGRLYVEACVSQQIERARDLGADLRFHQAVVNWTEDRREVRVCTDRGSYTAGRLIFTAGAWTDQIVRRLSVPLLVRRKVQAWCTSPKGAYSESPCFFFEEPEGEFYGIPDPSGGWVKVAEHTGGEEVDDPALVNRMPVHSDRERLETFVQRRLTVIDPGVLQENVCLYTMSPDGHFILDRLPGSERVWCAAGFSGHGFKFCVVIGEALADLATEGTTDLPVGFLRLARLGPL